MIVFIDIYHVKLTKLFEHIIENYIRNVDDNNNYILQKWFKEKKKNDQQKSVKQNCIKIFIAMMNTLKFALFCGYELIMRLFSLWTWSKRHSYHLS